MIHRAFASGTDKVELAFDQTSACPLPHGCLFISVYFPMSSVLDMLEHDQTCDRSFDVGRSKLVDPVYLYISFLV